MPPKKTKSKKTPDKPSTSSMQATTSNLERLRVIREGHRRQVSKLDEELTKILQGEDKDYERLSVMRQLLDGKQESLIEMDQEILSVCEVTTIDKEIEESEEITASIIRLKCKIENASKVNMPSQQHVGSPQTTAQPVNQNAVRTRLPKLYLPKFKGDVTKWNTFWDSFQSAVHRNEGISNIDKFNYLNSVLEGAAARAIQGLTLTEANYDAAIKLLQERFGRPQQIISAHMDQLLKVSPCSNDRPASLRYVYDQICVHSRGLASLGVTSDQYGSLLIPVIMSKLPPEIRLQIARNSKDSVWKIEELLNVIKVEVEAREASEMTMAKTSEGGKSQSPGRDSKFRNQTPTANSLVSQQGGSFKIKCAYCRNEHYSASCGVVRDTAQRRSILERDKRCFNCLRFDHETKECTNPKKCRHCQQRHHQSICSTLDQGKPKEVSAEEMKTTTTVSNKAKGTVLLQTAKAVAVNDFNSKTARVRILLDTGSQRTYVTNRLKSRLNLSPVKSETLHLNTFGDERYTKQQCDVVSLRLQGSQGEIEISALCFPKICSAVSAKVNIDNHTHLQGLELADISIAETGQQDIDVLIGSDYYFDIVSGDVIRGSSGPVAVSSMFGWVLSGPTSAEESREKFTTTNLIIERPELMTMSPCDIHSENDELCNALQKFWDTESLGVREEPPASQSDGKEFLESIHFDEMEGRYEVGLPWKESLVPASNEYELCVTRLRQLHSRLKKNKELLKDYDNVIKDQINSGIIEAVPELDDDQAPMHFLPHHGVIRSDRETTKLRVVFDGSAKSDKSTASINECLEKGPNLVPHLFDIVVKFRGYPFAVVADIEKAFHQIQINPEDRKMLRFLWFDDIEKDCPQIKQFQFRRLVFGLTPSPAILASTIKHHLSKYEEKEPEVTSLLSSSLYVDDLAGGVFRENETVNLYDKAQEIMKDGGFSLRKWNSNCQSFREKIKRDEERKGQSVMEAPAEESETAQNLKREESASAKDVKPETEQFVKILGIYWDVIRDEFHHDLSELIEYAEALPATKRSVLKLSAKIFDPIGLLTPFTISMKVLFQCLCVEKVNWDESLEGEALAKWKTFINDLNALKNIRVPRCYANYSPTQSTVCSYQIHGFSDASERAYAAVVYLRTEFSNGETQVNIMTSKTRVAPIKRQSIPRLELLGASLLAQLVHSTQQTIQSVLPIEGTFLWTDSFTTLCWIKNAKAWKPYVQHRVSKIRELSNEANWNFCPGELNPADLPSRGCGGEQLAQNQSWWNGPKFLRLSRDHWPKSPQTSALSKNKDALQEVVKNPVSVTHSLVTTESKDHSVNLSQVIDIERYSSVTRLLRVTAYVLRFIRNAKKSVSNRETPKSPEQSSRKELNAQELNQAEMLWIKTVQTASFAKELEFLQSKRGTFPPVYVTQFNLFLNDQQIIRCKGRVSNAPLSEESKNPILLPSKHPLTNLIIQDVHSKIKHSGIRDTLTTIRERFWVPRGREAVKRILRKCVTCRRVEGAPYRPPPTPDLPMERVSLDPPFAHTGLDFIGPLYIHNGKSSKEKGSDKVYICLFTCASTRAIHLELTPSLSVESFLLAFRRFVNRQGLPVTLLSDNAKTFRSASKDIRKIIQSDEVMRYLTDNRITWNFIIERAPWWGGFWERMVKVVKQPLKKTVGRTTLNYDELQTIMVEIQAIVNARPLTYVYDDEESISTPLTPSHLITGRRITYEPNNQHFQVVSVNQTLTKRAKHHQRLLQQFTKRWQHEYLLSLRERANERCKKQNKESPISVGDIVIVKSDLKKRTFWKLGKIQELLPGRDGQIRSAKVKVAGKGERKPQVLRRVIQDLIPVEVSE
ncbi:uncharacterized protein LOC144648427 [Oculina patagonica]